MKLLISSSQITGSSSMLIDFKPELSMHFQRHYRNLVKSSYNKMFLGNITMCNLYQLNGDTVYNKDSDTFYENLGSKSPLRFTKYENYPLFNVQAGSFSIDWIEDGGVKNDSISIDVTVAPFSVMPSIGSFIRLHNEQYQGLFKVTPQQEDATMDVDSPRRVTLTMTRFLNDIIEPQVTERKVWLFNKNYSVNRTEYDLAAKLSDNMSKLVEGFTKENFSYSGRYLVDPSFNRHCRKFFSGLSNIPIWESKDNDGEPLVAYNEMLDARFLCLLAIYCNENDITTLANGTDINSFLATSENGESLLELYTLDDITPISEDTIKLLVDTGLMAQPLIPLEPSTPVDPDGILTVPPMTTLGDEDNSSTPLVPLDSSTPVNPDGDDDIPLTPLEPSTPVEPDEDDNIPLTPLEPSQPMPITVPLYSEMDTLTKIESLASILNLVGFDQKDLVDISILLLSVRSLNQDDNIPVLKYIIGSLSVLSKYFDINVSIDTYVGRVNYRTV